MPGDEAIRSLVNAAFRFVVDVEDERQAAFTECSLPTLEWEVEEVKEGGLNLYTHNLPGRRKSARVSLKNGVGKSELLSWYMDALAQQAKRKKVTISLLDLALKPVIVWHIENAYPIKWTSPQLKSDENAVAIQALELVCGNITVSLG